jgi:penicillin-binding protein 1C
LKPFIYGLALDAGLINPQTMLEDTSLTISSWNPENFDRDFVGPISATDALVRSRNLPAVQLANRLPGAGLYGLLQQAHVGGLRSPDFYGLALALGGSEIRLDELVRLYAMLAGGGVDRDLILTRGQVPGRSTRLLSPEASFLVLDMLRSNPRPGDEMTPRRRGAASRSRGRPARRSASATRGPPASSAGTRSACGSATSTARRTPRSSAARRRARSSSASSTRSARAASDGGDAAAVGPRARRGVRALRCAGRPALSGPHADVGDRRPLADRDVLDPPRRRDRRRDRPPRVSRPARRRPPRGLRVLAVAPASPLPPRRHRAPHAAAVRAVVPGALRRRPPAPHRLAAAASRLRLRDGEHDEIPFSAVADADGRRVSWFVDDAYVGQSEPGGTLFWPARPAASCCAPSTTPAARRAAARRRARERRQPAATAQRPGG